MFNAFGQLTTSWQFGAFFFVDDNSWAAPIFGRGFHSGIIFLNKETQTAFISTSLSQKKCNNENGVGVKRRS